MRTLLLLILLISSAPLSAQTIYAVVLGNQKYVVGSSTLHSGLFRSSDTGRTWEHLGPQNLKAYSMDAVDSSRGRILYIAAGNGVHRSVDSGRTWKIMTDWRMTEVMDVKVDQSDPRWVYAATAWGFWRSSDGGETWENPGGELMHRYVNNISVYDSVLSTLRDNKNIMISRDHGSTWTWENVDFGGVRMHIYDSQMLYKAGDSGVFMISPTEYVTVEDLTRNLPTRIVHALRVYGPHLFAGTWGEGVYRLDRVWSERWTPSGLEGSQVWRLVVKEY